MKFIEVGKGKYLIKGSQSIIVDEKEKLQLEKKELVLKDISSNDCQEATTKRIKKMNKKDKEIEESDMNETIEKTE